MAQSYKKLYDNGTKLYMNMTPWKSVPYMVEAFEKVGNSGYEYWVCLYSTFFIEKKDKDGNVVYEEHMESEKPMYNSKGNINRYAFRLPDEEILEQLPYLKLTPFK